MIRLLEFLWSGCFHHWETIRVEPYKYSGVISSGHCKMFTLRCTKCGETQFVMKTFTDK